MKALAIASKPSQNMRNEAAITPIEASPITYRRLSKSDSIALSPRQRRKGVCFQHLHFVFKKSKTSTFITIMMAAYYKIHGSQTKLACIVYSERRPLLENARAYRSLDA